MRTPSLRNVELRAPYMRNGRFENLQAVVDFYDRGGDFDAPNKDPLIRNLALTPQEKQDLLAFLTRTLTDPRLANELPPFDRPTLYTESTNVPVIEGTGIPANGGVVPRLVALEPPLVGNPSFTVGVFDVEGVTFPLPGQPGAGPTPQALLVIDDTDPGLSVPASGELVFQGVNLEDDGSGRGYASISVALPASNSAIGSEWFGRWYIDGAAAGGGPSVTPLFRFTIFEPRGTGLLFAGDFETGDTSQWDSMAN